MYRVITDVETTGKRSYNAHIVEAGAVVLDVESQEISSFHTLANPGEEALRVASPEALAVNRISLEEIRKAPPSEEAARNFEKFLSDFKDPTIQAFNNDFDLWFLARKPWLVPAKQWGECVMRAAMEIMNDADALQRFPSGQAKWPKLEEAARFFRVPYQNGHRALDDARTAAEVWVHIVRRRAENELFQDEARMVIENGF